MSLRDRLRQDLPASVVVFFVAVPLCLGIALASKAPLMAGLVAGIVGGVVVGLISGSSLGVSGPAAGLAVIVLNAIEDLGSFEAFLLALVLAGVLQVLLGAARAGVLAYFFPSSVIKGMLAGIGILIVLKQIPHALGHDSDPEGDYFFEQADGDTTFGALAHMLDDYSWSATLVAAVAMAILLLWGSKRLRGTRLAQILPGPLVAVLFGVLYELVTRRWLPGWTISEKHLVQVPVAESLTAIRDSLVHPDWSRIGDPRIWVTAGTIAVVASLETLLCVEATDKLDPDRRVTPTNRELLAQGVGNLTSGLIGGLPVTQVIVRSSANIQSGARSKLSGVLHGVWILVFVALLPQVLNLIPLAALASILIVVGFKLATPALFRDMLRQGWEQALPFGVTVAGIVFTDLLTGIGMGMAVGLVLILRAHFSNSHFLHMEATVEQGQPRELVMRMAEEVTFLNKGAIRRELDRVGASVHLVVDTSRTLHMDRDVAEILLEYERTAPQKGVQVTITDRSALTENLFSERLARVHRRIAERPPASPPLDLATQATMTPEDALLRLKSGNKRFRENRSAERDHLHNVVATSTGQWPFAAILGCMDSRADPALIFDQGIGDLFSVRVAGNVVDELVLGSLEYAAQVAGSKLIVVKGHTRCGAVKGACDGVEMGNLTTLLRLLHPAVQEAPEPTDPALRTSDNPDFLESVARTNVDRTVRDLRRRSDILRTLEQEGRIAVVGALHHVETGRVEFWEVPSASGVATA